MWDSTGKMIDTKINFWPSVVDGLTSILVILVLAIFIQRIKAAELIRQQAQATQKYEACAKDQKQCANRAFERDRQAEELRQKQRALEERLREKFQEAGVGDVITFQPGVNMLQVGFKSSVLFDSGDYSLHSRGKYVMKVCAEALADAEYAQIQVEGFTDDRPFQNSRSQFPTNNWELSAARALSVVHELANTIPNDRLSANGYGEQQPIAPNDNEADRSLNRRIELRIFFSKPGDAN